MNKTVNSVVIVVVVVAAGWYILSGHGVGGSGAIAGANDTVAVVNGTLITRSQLTKMESQIAVQQGLSATSTAVQAQLQSNALNSLIGETLLSQAAEQAGITASSTEVDAQLATTKSQFSTSAAYEQALAAQGMTEADLRTQISKNLVVSTYLEQKLSLSTATATDAEVRTAYSQISAQQKGTPPLNQVRTQVAQMVVQQKQQNSISAYVTQLRSAANVQILIATSTPAV